MKNFLKTFNPTFNYYKMKNKTLFNSLLFTFAFIGSLFAIEKPLKASVAGPVCPDPSTTTINSVFDPSDPSGSFIGLTGGYGEDGGGFCRGTPTEYGVTVFKMGFCTKNPGNPTGSAILEGSKPDYSSCTWAFENAAGEKADFGAGGAVDLSDVASKEPAAGVYPHAVMLISKDFRIKGKYGPIGGQTFYTTETFEESTTDVTQWKTVTAPLTSFVGSDFCKATTEGEVVSGGTISAYLLDTTGTMLVSDTTETGTPCTGQEYLLGVMNMSSDLIISDTTSGLKMTFLVTNNGMSVITKNDPSGPPTEIIMDSGPFSVTFDTF
tara:strand:+ start:101 stop:1069 length:969 start_codon:yes stop_codon:yes gene_type:complete